jgi:3-keto-5-aminohexanoate cleavage enzyme
MEIFDCSMINNAVQLVKKELAAHPIHFDFVLGLKGAMPATAENLIHLKNSIPSASTWTVAGIGRHQLSMALHAILMGGHARVGLEDNIYYKSGDLATNEQLVERIVRLSKEIGRDIASPDEAREMLSIKTG